MKEIIKVYLTLVGFASALIVFATLLFFAALRALHK